MSSPGLMRSSCVENPPIVRPFHVLSGTEYVYANVELSIVMLPCSARPDFVFVRRGGEREREKRSGRRRSGAVEGASQREINQQHLQSVPAQKSKKYPRHPLKVNYCMDSNNTYIRPRTGRPTLTNREAG